jgi:2-phospho-L-lactate/phosphoenolpyruvate guanylyltransferase
MQGTVATFDPVDRTTVVYLDNGTPVSVPAAAFNASGLRLLRSGQRVRLDQLPGGPVTGLSLITM